MTLSNKFYKGLTCVVNIDNHDTNDDEYEELQCADGVILNYDREYIFNHKRLIDAILNHYNKHYFSDLISLDQFTKLFQTEIDNGNLTKSDIEEIYESDDIGYYLHKFKHEDNMFDLVKYDYIETRYYQICVPKDYLQNEFSTQNKRKDYLKDVINNENFYEGYCTYYKDGEPIEDQDLCHIIYYDYKNTTDDIIDQIINTNQIDNMQNIDHIVINYTDILQYCNLTKYPIVHISPRTYQFNIVNK